MGSLASQCADAAVQFLLCSLELGVAFMISVPDRSEIRPRMPPVRCRPRFNLALRKFGTYRSRG